LNQKKAYIYAALTILFWSTVAAVFKTALISQSGFQILIVAVIVTLVILFGFLVAGKRLSEVFTYKPLEYLYSAILGFLNPFLYYLLLFAAYNKLPAQVAQPLNMVWPLLLVLISIPLLGQKISWKSFIALLISFSGVLLVSSQGGGADFKIEQVPYMLLALGSSVIWAFFWILNIRDKRDEIPKLFLNFGFALIYLLIAMPILGESFPTGRKEWALDIYIGFFEMGFAFICWFKALKYSETTDKVSNLIFIFPFFSLIFIHYIIGEKIYLSTILGLILVITGILFQKADEKRKARHEKL
jgi:drug/metabolite transporter (DMT)-like permease